MESKTLKASVEVKISVEGKLCSGFCKFEDDEKCILFNTDHEICSVSEPHGFYCNVIYNKRCKECLETFGE